MEETNRRLTKYMIATLSTLLASVGLSRIKCWESEAKHVDFSQTVINGRPEGSARIEYLRFNVSYQYDVRGGTQPTKYRLSKIKLGEWRGEDGATIKQYMQDAVTEYLNSPGQRDRIHDCAKAMVEVRRERQRTVRWEPFAMHVEYICPVEGQKCEGQTFESRSKLRQHAVEQRGFVWKVMCVGSDRKVLFQWACLWDQCGERQVSVFADDATFKRHLADYHNNNEPTVMEDSQFESWLNSGLKVKTPAISRTQTMASYLNPG